MKLALKRLAAFSAMAAALALLCSCAGMASHELGIEDNGSTLNISTGDTVNIELEGNPTTGYLWTFGAPYDPNMLVMTSESYSKPDAANGKVGVPVKRLMSFKAFSPGRTGIKLDYRRPWEQNEKPLKSFEVLVVITGKPLEEPEASDETPRVGSDGKPAKEPIDKLLGK